MVLCAGRARADELHLANGDRVTGTVVSLANGTLAFKTAHGTLDVPWKDVVALTTDHPLLVRRTGAEPVLTTITAATAADLAGITEIAAPPTPVVWKGGANLGLLTTSGNTETSSLRIDGDATARTPRDRYNSTLVVNRTADKGVETARNWTSSFLYDRFVSKRLFLEGSLIFTNDPFRDLDLRTAIALSVGYQAWESPRGALSVNAGFGHVRENFIAAPDDSFSAIRESTKLDIDFLDGKRIHLFHHHDGYFGQTMDNQLFFRMQNGVRVTIIGKLVSTVEFDLDYDRHPAPGRVGTDRSVSLTFGYRF